MSDLSARNFSLDLDKVKRIVFPNRPNEVLPAVLSTEPAPVPTREALMRTGSCTREAQC
jgi:hypothetical protein